MVSEICMDTLQYDCLNSRCIKPRRQIQIRRPPALPRRVPRRLPQLSQTERGGSHPRPPNLRRQNNLQRHRRLSMVVLADVLASRVRPNSGQREGHGQLVHPGVYS